MLVCYFDFIGQRDECAQLCAQRDECALIWQFLSKLLVGFLLNW